MFSQGLESLCPGHNLLASCFNSQREGLILTARASTARGALGEVLGGNLAGLTVFDGNGLHGSSIAQRECRLVEGALSSRRRAIGGVTDLSSFAFTFNAMIVLIDN